MNAAFIEIKKLPPKHVPIALLYSLQKCRCFYCKTYMEYITHNDKMKKGYTVDHLFPRSKGYGRAGNIVLSCRRCNEKKGDRFPTIDETVDAWQLYNQMNRPFIATIILP